MDFDAIVYLPGNDYTRHLCSGFLSDLGRATGKPVKFVQLLENKSKSLGYDKLDPRSYSDYIARSIGRPGKYLMAGISMGCLHIANFSHFYPDWCYPVMVMIEPTIVGGDYQLLHEFEAGRGNGEWLADLKTQPNNLNIPANEKVMDIAIDDHYDIPKGISIGVVFTTRSNEDTPYTSGQIRAKTAYYHKLSRNHKTYLLRLNTSHCVDTQPSFYPRVINFILKILKVN